MTKKIERNPMTWNDVPECYSHHKFDEKEPCSECLCEVSCILAKEGCGAP